MKIKTKIWLLMGALVTLMMVIDVTLSYRKIDQVVWSDISSEARDVYGIIMSTRRIYQQQFLENNIQITNQTIGLLPAHSLSRIAKDFANWTDNGIVFNNVSDRPRNPNNLADAFEQKAIAWFRENPNEQERLERITTEQNIGYLLYTAPIWTEAYCLKCHGDPADAPKSISEQYSTGFYYKVGDLRGVASIKIPTGRFDKRFMEVWGGEITKSVIGYTMLFFILSIILDRLVLNRLITLQRSAEKIASGEYGTRTTPQGNDEISGLANAFNHMADKVQRDIADLTSTEAELKAHQTWLTAFMEALPDAVVVKDGAGHWQLTNQAARNLFRINALEWHNKSDMELAAEHPELTPIHEACHSSDITAWKNSEITISHQEMHGPNNRLHTFEVRKMPIFEADNQRSALVIISRDITKRRAYEEEVRKLSRVVEQSRESIVITNLEGEIEYVNESFLQTTGYSREEVIGRNPRVLQSGKTPEETYTEMWETLSKGQVWHGEFINLRKDGSEYIELATVAPVRERDGRVTHYVATKQDITEAKQTHEELHRLASFDNLTTLPNRSLLMDRMEQLVAAGHRSHQISALILINIDRFKTINNARGIHTGDILLKSLGQRINRSLRAGDTLARLSADEFALLLPNLGTDTNQASWDTLAVAEKTQTALSHPFLIDNEKISVTASLGITLFPESQEDISDSVLRRANTALHRSKENGGNQSSFFETGMGEKAEQRFRVERELRGAIEAGDLALYLQPQMDSHGQLAGAEALVRWNHPERGLLPPGTFIPIAEESNLIIDLDSWMISQVCELIAREEMAGTPIHISVNLSPRHFQQTGFVPWMRDLLIATGADPTHLTIEVTEGLLINNINDAIIKMADLSEIGIHFSLDDFGTGHSSLSYLKRLPIHELKIDKMFVQDAPTDPDDAALVNTILAVAEHLHLRVVVEGVETKEQVAFFNNRPSVIYQGYLFGKPRPAETWIEEWKSQQPEKSEATAEIIT